MELQDFQTKFICVAPNERKGKFEREISKTAFSPLQNRVEFYSYEDVEHDYNLSLQRYRILWIYRALRVVFGREFKFAKREFKWKIKAKFTDFS